MRPGITGWAQVKGCQWSYLTTQESIILRHYWDAQYVRKSGFLLDLKILCLTLACKESAQPSESMLFDDRSDKNDPEVIEMTKLESQQLPAF